MHYKIQRLDVFFSFSHLMWEDSQWRSFSHPGTHTVLGSWARRISVCSVWIWGVRWTRLPNGSRHMPSAVRVREDKPRSTPSRCEPTLFLMFTRRQVTFRCLHFTYGSLTACFTEVTLMTRLTSSNREGNGYGKYLSTTTRLRTCPKSFGSSQRSCIPSRSSGPK